MSNGIALVTELRHPTINSANAKDIICFKVQYLSYLHQIAELNNSRADNDKLIPTGIYHCFEPRVLEALIGMGVFDEFVENEGDNETSLNSADELTHEIAGLWIDYMAESLEADIPSRVEEALSAICFEYNRMVARGSTLSFFTEIYTKIAEAGCKSAIESSGNEPQGKSFRNWNRQTFAKLSQRSGDIGRQKTRMNSKSFGNTCWKVPSLLQSGQTRSAPSTLQET
jgi:hypothetical protein